MEKDLKVVLAKADFCGHCKDFLPIFKRATELAKKEIPDAEFVIEELDTRIEPMAHINFEKKYGTELLKQIRGYPTVILMIGEDDNKKVDLSVEHTVGETEEAAKNFILNVKNGYKTMKSNGKSEFVSVNTQQGGRCYGNNNLDEKYRAKYIKYKSKYLELLKSSKK